MRLSVLHQRLRDEHGLGASWATFYRYVAEEWPERVRLDNPAPGEEAQVDFMIGSHSAMVGGTIPSRGGSGGRMAS